MKSYYATLAGLGAATLIMAWLPSISKKLKVSYTIFLLLIGALLYFLKLPMIYPSPVWSDKILMQISEAIVIISLMGTGLKIGKNYSLRDWKVPIRLILITMPLTMLAVYFLGSSLFALSMPAAILLAASLAPTDPVMASEVQIENVEESKREDPVAFALTAEAGINDGLAFPFVFLAVLMADAELDMTQWFLDKFLLKIIIGVAAGYAIGRLVGYSIERLPKIKGISNPHGFVSLSITFMTYGITELIHGYGFLAVFVAALSIRYTEEVEGDIKVKMHDFVEEIEKLLLVAWIILFGGHLLNDVLSFAGWKGALFALLFILVIRPISGWIGLLGSKVDKRQTFIISFCGIRGIGSMFYLSWAFLKTEAFTESALLYSITAYVILFSIIIHGLASPRVMDE